MNIALAITYIPQRMQELGYEKNYFIHFKHLVLQAQEAITLEADNQLYLLINAVADVSIRSDTGCFDVAADTFNEQCYEHQGSIHIHNYSNQLKHVQFIQVIPKH